MTMEVRQLASQQTTIAFSNGTTLSGMGGVGTVKQRRPAQGRLRSAALPSELDTSPAFEQALGAIGIHEQETIELEATQLAAADSVTLAPAAAPGDAARRVVLYQDESGGISWHFEQPSSRKRPGLRAGRAPQFVIPLRQEASRRTLQAGMPRRNLRGPITKVGRKIFKVFVLPIASALLKDPVRWLGEKVEQRYRSNRLWQVTPDNYRHPPEAPSDDWSLLSGGPVLLLVHGIFSSVEGMLAGLPRSVMAQWHARYQGRVFAFNHLTVSASPEDNARALFQALRKVAPDARPVFDILCHSRGGIVSRAVTEQGHLLGGDGCQVRSVYFVATPNAGSPLGDADHMIDMIDLFTNCLTSLPDGPVSYSLEVLLGLVTLVGHAGAKALPGIAALGTAGSYVSQVLNRSTAASPAIYAAAAADFEPQPGRDNGWMIDRLADPAMDRVFERDGQRQANDLVVPQQGVFAANGHPSFPIDDPLVYAASDGIWHTAFFSQERTIRHIEAHFDRVGGVAAASPVVPEPVPVAKRASVPPAPQASPASPRMLRSLRSGGEFGRPGSSSEFSTFSLQIPLPSPGGPIAPRGGLRRSPAASSAKPSSPPPTKPPRKAAASLPAETVTRDPKLDFPEQVQAGATERLRVQLALPDDGPAPAERMSLSFEPGAQEIDLVAEVSAPGFAIDGARHAALKILRQRDASLEQAEFCLTALAPADGKPVERAIIVSFFRGNECVGGITRHVMVLPKGGKPVAAPRPERVSPVSVSSRRREAADLVISVRRLSGNDTQFSLSLRSQVPGQEYESRDFGQFNLDGKELAVYLADALDPSFDGFPDGQLSDAEFGAALAEWNANFMATLADFGKQLWRCLPQPFRDEYLRMAGLFEPPRSISVYSDELLFPWEIVRPCGAVNGQYTELPPMGVSHILGRWQPGLDARPQPQARPVSGMAIVMPDAQASGLPWAAQEVDALRELLPVAKLLAPASLRQVRALLADGEAQVVHFSGHGQLGANADLMELGLEGGECIKAMAFADCRLGQVHHPMLYLNACTVGRAGKVLGRSGGFAGNCVASGWSGVVAPYWPVYDPSASAFSVAFYRKLKAGRAVGEALCELREEMRDDPTAQAYAYYGDPFARLMFDR